MAELRNRVFEDAARRAPDPRNRLEGRCRGGARDGSVVHRYASAVPFITIGRTPAAMSAPRIAAVSSRRSISRAISSRARCDSCVANVCGPVVRSVRRGDARKQQTVQLFAIAEREKFGRASNQDLPTEQAPLSGYWRGWQSRWARRWKSLGVPRRKHRILVELVKRAGHDAAIVFDPRVTGETPPAGRPNPEADLARISPTPQHDIGSERFDEARRLKRPSARDGRNGPCEAVYRRHGFDRLGDGRRYAPLDRAPAAEQENARQQVRSAPRRAESPLRR